MFDCSPVYQANHESTADIVIDQGGTDSGKTYGVVQVLYTIATTIPPPKTDAVITVVGESVPNLKKGAYRIAKEIYANSIDLQHYVRDWNETDRVIYFKNGWIIEFTSYENVQQAKQGKRQYLFCNEAQAIQWNVFWQLAKRTRVRTFIDYNPTAPFWAHDNLIGTSPEGNDLNASVQLILSDHRHNPFLTEAEHRKTENIKDKDLWRVYARGLTGNLEGIIFPNWKKIPDNQFPIDERFFGAIDYGYTNDPTAALKMIEVGDNLFLHQLCYSPGLSHVEIKQIFIANGFKKSNMIYSEHDPEMIRDIRKLGGLTIMRAKKGPGSVNAGIRCLKQYNVFYTESSTDIDNERKRYMWDKDPKSGKSLNEPIDAWNHCLDASRYGIYTKKNSGVGYL